MVDKLGTLICIGLVGAFLFQCGSEKTRQSTNDRGFDISKSDARAIQIVDEMWEAMGGKDNWDQARYLSYHWIVEREGTSLVDHRHDWDRYTNRYRLEGTNRQGEHFVALFNTQTREGDVYLEGTKLPEDTTKTKMLEGAYSSFINDSYWLIMPYKLNDPGVILTYEGEREGEGTVYDVIKVTFENVGLTPGDTYWAFIDKTDRLMHKWEYVLQSYPADRKPSASSWKDWQTFGGIKLAMNKEFEGRPIRIYFKQVVVSPSVDEEIFQSTARTF